MAAISRSLRFFLNSTTVSLLQASNAICVCGIPVRLSHPKHRCLLGEIQDTNLTCSKWRYKPSHDRRAMDLLPG